MTIHFDHVTHCFSSSTEPILEDINMTIETGELFLILGESGSGKTTLLKMINGLIRPTEGTVFIDEKPISRYSEKEMTQLRRTIGYCVQGSMLFPTMTAQENISFVPYEITPRSQQKIEHKDLHKSYIELTCSLAKKVHFPLELLGRYPRELSGGQQQRIAIARGLAARGSIFLADEPFSALDPIVRRDLQDLVLELHEENRYTTVMVTHDIREAVKLADRMCIINDRHIEQVGTPQEIMNHPATDYVRRLIEAGVSQTGKK